MAISRESIEELLKDEEKNWRVERLEEVSIDLGAAGSGANYMSSIVRADLSIVLLNGNKTKSSVIIKELMADGGYSEFVKSHSLFTTEIKLYNEILPLMAGVLKEQNIPLLWPEFLGQKGNCLIFKDLKNKNYRVADRIKKMDLDHASITVRTLALFHSASIVLDQRGQLDVKDIPRSFFFQDTPQIRKFNEQALRMAANVILKEWGQEWKDIGERIHMKSYTIHDEILQLAVLNRDRLNVLCHGDPWTANMMFKYSKSTDRPIGLRLLDFQIAHYNSYVYDLLYFITSSVRPELRRSSTRRLLEEYTETLWESLEFYGLGHLSPSLDDAVGEWKRLQLANLIFAFSTMAITGSPVENAFSVDALFEGKGDPFNPDIYRGTFKENISVELLNWSDMGLF